MKILIAGSRSIKGYSLFIQTVNNALATYCSSVLDIEEIISGGGKGVNTMITKFCGENNIKNIIVLPQWEQYGKSAESIRNMKMIDMLNTEDIIVIIWDGISKGTQHILDLVKKKKLNVYLKIQPSHNQSNVMDEFEGIYR